MRKRFEKEIESHKIEVKKGRHPIGLNVAEDFWEKVQVYSSQQAEKFCQDHKIGMATEIRYVKTDW